MRKGSIRGVIEDAISDRESYRDACATAPDFLPAIDRDLADLRALRDRYRDGGRVVLDDAGRTILANACEFALIWRRSFVDAIGNFEDKAVVRRARQDVRVASALLDKLRPDRPNPSAGARLVSIHEIEAKKLGTRVVETRENGVATRTISEDGMLIGTVVTEADGVVKARLADGSTVNEHFEEAFDAQEWLLARFSRNVVFRDPEVARPRI